MLIKVVASGLPVSAMSVYKIPKTVLESLSSALACFWWSAVEHKQKYTLDKLGEDVLT